MIDVAVFCPLCSSKTDSVRSDSEICSSYDPFYTEYALIENSLSKMKDICTSSLVMCCPLSRWKMCSAVWGHVNDASIRFRCSYCSFLCLGSVGSMGFSRLSDDSRNDRSGICDYSLDQVATSKSENSEIKTRSCFFRSRWKWALNLLFVSTWLHYVCWCNTFSRRQQKPQFNSNWLSGFYPK